MTLLNSNSKTSKLARAGITAALYFIAVMIFFPISFGGVQARIAESLTILPIFMPEAIWGLWVGCLLSNLIGGNGLIDIVFGSSATLIAAILTYFISKFIKNKIAKFIVGGFFPVIINAIIVPFTFLLVTELKELYFISFIQVFIGQFLSIYIIGGFLYFTIEKLTNKKKVN